ncbi:MAG: serine/threonine-protein kinase [Pirellulales bacterium]
MSTTNTSADQFFEQAQKLSLLQGAALRKAQAEIGNEQEAETIARKLIRAGIISRWAASQFLKGRSLRWGKYQLIDQIGKELNSPVYLAEHTQMERRVVLKILTEAQASRGELRAVAQLDHRNLVHVYDIDHQNDKYYLVMEFVEGIDLAHILSDGAKPPPENSAAYMYQAALGLAHAHGRGIVHRQIHPGNLMVDHEGVVKILNLDAARPTEMVSEAGSKIEQLPLELVDYISPEQASGRGKIDHRSDVYSLGCVFYHLLTGRPPYAADSVAARLEAHQTSVATPISQLALQTPPPLIEVCERMMAKDPQARYQSADEVAVELDQWLNEFEETRRATTIRRKPPVAAVSGIEATGTSPVDRLKPTRKPVFFESLTKQQKIAIAAASGVAAMLLLIGVVAVMLLSGQDAELAQNNRSEVVDGSAADAPMGDQPPGADAARATEDNNPLDEEFPEPGQLAGGGKPDGEGGPNGADEPAPPEVPANPKDEEPAAPDPMPKPDPDAPPAEPEVDDPPTDNGDPAPEETDTPPENEQPEPEPQQPKAVEPFKNFPAAVSLPEVGSADEVSPAPAVALGSVELPADANLYVSLLGGDSAAPGNLQFAARTSDEAEPARKWQIYLMQPDGSETPLAEMGLTEGDLSFQWLLQAQENRAANYLRNCAVSLQSEDVSHRFRLREPLQAAPITLDLDKPRMRTNIDLDWLPEKESVMIEFTNLEGEFSDATWDPGATIAADGGRAALNLGTNADRVLQFQLRSDVRRGLQLELASFFKVDSEQQPLAFSKTVAERRATEVLNANTKLTQQITTMKAVKDANRKKALEPQVKFLQEQQVIANRALDQFNLLKQHYNALNGEGKIHFRVYCQVGDEQIVLATSE